VTCTCRDKQVTRVINEAGEVIHAVARTVQPPLIRAARSGDAASVRHALQDGGAAPNTRARDHHILGSTALHLAAQLGHVDVARELIAAEAHLELRDAMGMTPIERALLSSRPGCAEVCSLVSGHVAALTLQPIFPLCIAVFGVNFRTVLFSPHLRLHFRVVQVASILDGELCTRAVRSGHRRDPTVQPTARAEAIQSFEAASKREAALIAKIQHKLEFKPECRHVSLVALLGSYVF
jgi:hypothetical protein